MQPREAADFTTVFAEGLARHQSGDLAGAEVCYRRTLQLAQDHFDAWHLLGVVALQCARFDDAETFLNRAIQLSPSNAVARSNLGTLYLRQQRYQEALSQLTVAVDGAPDVAAGRLNLGIVLSKLGKLEQAAEQLEQAIALDPDLVSARSNLGAVYLELEQFPDAIRAFSQVVRISPKDADAYANLAAAYIESGDPTKAMAVLDEAARALTDDTPSLLRQRGIAASRLGEFDQAAVCFRRVLDYLPDSAADHRNLGNLFREAGNYALALPSLKLATELDPQPIDAWLDLINACRESGDKEGAKATLYKLCDERPDATAPLRVLGAWLMEDGDRVGAEQAWWRTVTLDQGDAEALYQLGNLRMLDGRAKDARMMYRRAADADHDHAASAWALAMATIPPIAEDSEEICASRESFGRALFGLEEYFDEKRIRFGFQAVGSTQPYYLAYQAQNNRELLSQYGRLCNRLMADWQQRNVLVKPRHPSLSRRVRVGIASAHLYDHSVWHAIVKGWLKHIDRNRFELIIFYLGSQRDSETAKAIAWADHFHEHEHDLIHWTRAITAANLDILVYPEIGMHAMTTRLASLRLAPVQVSAWGHPETTGLPTIDHFLSATRFEPEGADAHYTERLVKLPNLGVCYEPLRVNPREPNLPELRCAPEMPLLLCAGQPQKYSPENDWIWTEIAARLPQARLIFFGNPTSGLSGTLHRRLKKAFLSKSLNPERALVFVPSIDRSSFYGLLRRANLLLDSVGFSGFNTVMQAIECGLPVLTREGQFLRGRFGSGILQHFGAENFVAKSDIDFIRLAVDFVQTREAPPLTAYKLSHQINPLFLDLSPIRAFENFILNLALSHS